MTNLPVGYTGVHADALDIHDDDWFNRASVTYCIRGRAHGNPSSQCCLHAPSSKITASTAAHGST